MLDDRQGLHGLQVMSHPAANVPFRDTAQAFLAFSSVEQSNYTSCLHSAAAVSMFTFQSNEVTFCCFCVQSYPLNYFQFWAGRGTTCILSCCYLTHLQRSPLQTSHSPFFPLIIPTLVMICSGNAQPGSSHTLVSCSFKITWPTCTPLVFHCFGLSMTSRPSAEQHFFFCLHAHLSQFLHFYCIFLVRQTKLLTSKVKLQLSG